VERFYCIAIKRDGSWKRLPPGVSSRNFVTATKSTNMFSSNVFFTICKESATVLAEKPMCKVQVFGEKNHSICLARVISYTTQDEIPGWSTSSLVRIIQWQMVATLNWLNRAALILRTSNL
jgi:hypothetical protein